MTPSGIEPVTCWSQVNHHATVRPTFKVCLHDIFVTSACLYSCTVLWSFVLGEKEVPVKEPKRSRPDLSASILEQLTTPLHDFVAPRPQMPEGSELPGNKVVESNNLNTGVDQAQDVKVCLFVEVCGLNMTYWGQIIMCVFICLPTPV